MLGSSSQHGAMRRWSFFSTGMAGRIRLSAIQGLILTAAALIIAITVGTGYYAMQYRERALEELNVDLAHSYVVGDKTSDVQLGRNAGCKAVLVRCGAGGQDERCEVVPDLEAADLAEAAEMIIKDAGSRKSAPE